MSSDVIPEKYMIFISITVLILTGMNMNISMG